MGISEAYTSVNTFGRIPNPSLVNIGPSSAGQFARPLPFDHDVRPGIARTNPPGAGEGKATK